jgi:membrane protease YdiL (CAAX protease family)
MPIAQATQEFWLAAAGLLFVAALVASLAAWLRVFGLILRRQPLFSEEARGLDPSSWLGQIGLRDLAGVALLYVAVQLAAGAVYAALRRAGRWQGAEGTELTAIPPSDQILLVTFVNLVTVLLVPGLLRRLSWIRPRDLWYSDRESLVRDIRLGLTACLLVSPVVYGIFLVASHLWKPMKHPVFESISARLDVSTAALAIISAVVAAPLAEEVLFRGVLLGWLMGLMRGVRRLMRRIWARRETEDDLPPDYVPLDPLEPPDMPADEFRMPAPPLELDPAKAELGRFWVSWVPNIIVSLVFALVHAPQWPAPLPLFCLSLVLGSLVQKTGRLAASVALHAGFNGFSTALTLLATLGGAEVAEPREAHPEVVPLPAPAAPAPAPGGILMLGAQAPRELTRGRGDLGCEWWQRPESAPGGGSSAPESLCRGSSRIPQDRKWTNEAPPSFATWRRSTAASPAEQAIPLRPRTT